MTIKEMQKKELNNYSKDEIIEVLLMSGLATGFVISKCKERYGSKPKPTNKPKKEAPADAKNN